MPSQTCNINQMMTVAKWSNYITCAANSYFRLCQLDKPNYDIIGDHNIGFHFIKVQKKIIQALSNFFPDLAKLILSWLSRLFLICLDIFWILLRNNRRLKIIRGSEKAKHCHIVWQVNAFRWISYLSAWVSFKHILKDSAKFQRCRTMKAA